MQITQPPTTDTWKQISLQHDNPDKGGQFLYAIRYDLESLCNHQNHVIAAMQKSGATLEGGNPFYYSGPKILLEELSVVNEAIALKSDPFLDFSSVTTMARSLQLAYYSKRARVFVHQSERRRYVAEFLPDLAINLISAHYKKNLFTPQEVKELEKLLEFAHQKARYHF